MNKTNFDKKYPSAISVFNQWAKKGKDKGMETGHFKSVSYMIDEIELFLQQPFTVLDIGCGNGWVVRKFSKMHNCIQAVGVDGAKNMIDIAQKMDQENTYFCNDLLTWVPEKKFDIIHSMEVLYYLENPKSFIKKIYTDYLNSSGIFIFGIDHYLENKQSISWPEDVGVNMNTKPIHFWKDSMLNAGFRNIKISQAGAENDWLGTLVVSGIK